MKPPTDAVRTHGIGPDVVFIHGTAADKSSWSPAVALLRGRLRATIYDRRGTAAWPVTDDDAVFVHDHVEDAADVIRGLGPHPVHVCAASFGAVVAIELLRRHPQLVRSAALFEPVLSGDVRLPPVPVAFIETFERFVRNGEPERAAEYFFRRTYGDARWASLPCPAQRQAASRWPQIRVDLLATRAYRVDYGALRDVDRPVLLMQGGRSHRAFEPCLRALAAAMPRSRRQRIPCAEHAPRGSAWNEFASALTAFIEA